MNLEHFPNEIIYHIFSWLSSTDLLRISEIPPFDIFCDWDFFSRRAREDFQVPIDYFILGFQRNISPGYRYLELVAKYKPNIYCLARIEGNVVSGIYEPVALLMKAIERRDGKLIEQVLEILKDGGKIDTSTIEFDGKSIPDLIDFGEFVRPSYYCDTGFGGVAKRLGSCSGVNISMPLYEGWVRESRWDKINSFIKVKWGYGYLNLLLMLIYSKKHQALKIVESELSSIPEIYLEICFRASLNSNNHYITDLLLQLAPGLLSSIDSPCIDLRYYGKYDLVCVMAQNSLVVDTCISGNLQLIQKILKDKVPDFSKMAIYLSYGYKLTLANPVSVYNIFEELQEEKFVDPPPDIDIWQLILDDPKIKWDKSEAERLKYFLELLFGKIKEQLAIYSDPGNVDLLNFILNKFILFPGVKKVMEEFTIPEYYPLSRKILQSYLTIAK